MPWRSGQAWPSRRWPAQRFVYCRSSRRLLSFAEPMIRIAGTQREWSPPLGAIRSADSFDVLDRKTHTFQAPQNEVSFSPRVIIYVDALGGQLLLEGRTPSRRERVFEGDRAARHDCARRCFEPFNNRRKVLPRRYDHIDFEDWLCGKAWDRCTSDMLNSDIQLSRPRWFVFVDFSHILRCRRSG
jgi:hypothetical protein